MQDRLGLKLASYLSLGSDELSYEATERLRAARVRALAARKRPQTQTAVGLSSQGGVAVLLGPFERIGWWHRLVSVMPLIALVMGLLTINQLQNERRAQEVAEVDSALLTDELPPSAYVDAGFMAFLNSSAEVDN